MSPWLSQKNDALNQGLYVLNDMSHFRGKLLDCKSFDSSNNLVLSKEYIFNSNKALEKYQVAVRSKTRGCSAYKIYTNPCQLVSEKCTSENGIVTQVDYLYNSRGLVSEKSTVSSDGKKESILFKYPTDYTDLVNHDDSSAIKNLVEKNIIAEPVELSSNVYIDSIPMSKGGVLNKYKEFSFLGYPLKSSQFKMESNELQVPFSPSYYTKLSEVTKFSDYDLYGNIQGLSSRNGIKSTYQWDNNNQYLLAMTENAIPYYEKIDTFINNNILYSVPTILSGNFVLIKPAQICLFRKYTYQIYPTRYYKNFIKIRDESGVIVWSKTDVQRYSEMTFSDFVTLPVGIYHIEVNSALMPNPVPPLADKDAGCVLFTVSKNSNILLPYSTSFENESANVSRTVSKTGLQSHLGSYLLDMPIINTPIILSFWGKVSSNSPWTYVEETITTNTVKTRTIGQGFSFIDEVRLYPKGARMTTYTYAPSKGMTSQTAPNNQSIHYEYDSKNRLEYIKDNEGKIINKYDYHFKNQ